MAKFSTFASNLATDFRTFHGVEIKEPSLQEEGNEVKNRLRELVSELNPKAIHRREELVQYSIQRWTRWLALYSFQLFEA